MKKRQTFRKKISLIFSLTLISILMVLFFWQFNILIQQNYRIKDYEGKIIRLSRENEALEIKLIEKNHLANLEKKASALNFEKAQKVHYIRVLGSTVVAR